jgi:hypothetical protein
MSFTNQPYIMQKLLQILAFSCCFFISLSAQTSDFAPLGAKWHYSEEAFIPPPFGVFPRVVEVVEKVQYQGKLCSKLVGIGSETLPNPTYFFSQNDSVFFYSLLTSRFELLYDFTATAGDSWIIDGLNSPTGIKSINVLVDSVGQVMVSGETCKVQFISSNDLLFFDWGNVIIEGIGCTNFLTPDYGLYEGGPIGIRCYEDATTDLHFVSYPCDTTIMISSTNALETAPNFSIFPNPTREYLNIIADDVLSGATVEVYNSLGILQITHTLLQGGNSTVVVEKLPSGLYFWALMVQNKKVRSGKFVKGE